MRKVLGGNRRQLILQFLGEAAVVNCFALFIGLALWLLTGRSATTIGITCVSRGNVGLRSIYV